jgi:hypothetical protein
LRVDNDVLGARPGGREGERAGRLRDNGLALFEERIPVADPGVERLGGDAAWARPTTARAARTIFVLVSIMATPVSG